MNKIKLLVTLFVGIFIGCVIVTMLPNNNKINITPEKPSDVPSTQAILPQKTTQNSKATITTPTTLNADKRVNMDSNTSHSTDKQISSSAYQALERKYQELSKTHQSSKNKVASLQRKLDQFDDSDITTEQMEALVVEPFKSHIGNFTGAERNDIYNFHQAEEDLDWGYNMQNYISDFILTHYNVNEINLVSVICKQQKCELLIIQLIDGGWEKIARDFGQQPWWKFKYTSSTSSNYPGSKTNLAIYTFLSL
jgi:hypothetical protein